MAAWHGHLEAVKTLVGAGACLAATNKVCCPSSFHYQITYMTHTYDTYIKFPQAI